MSAHVPAWKRLGLKLKGPASEAIPSSGGSNPRANPSAQVPNAHQTRANGGPASALKRKLPSSAPTPNAQSSQTPNKKPRREDQSAADQETPSSLRKSVSFADGTKDNAKDKAEKKAKKKKKAKKTSDTAKSDFNLEPSLNYLRQWHTARDSWKFNKNHQTLLIKYVFDGDKVPSTHIPIFYEYIRDLKGFVRTRLRETAAEIKKTDMEAGAGGFPASLKDKETKQKEYEETISRFLQDLQQHQPKDTSKNANGKRTLDEVEYVLRIATPEVKQRLVKRIRAELVANELSDSEESTGSGATATASTSSSSSSSSGSRAAVAVTDETAGTRRNDGSQQPAKRRRLRNVRTDIVDDDDSSSSSSDSSESESGSEESGSEESSSDSDDESEDEEMDMAPGGGAAESSSSSSSSSSESESEAESEEEEESESGSSDSDED
ncbi:hypothetical protein P885DRAFT_38557 [Corynascus similis CBS 632.67]